MGPGSQTRGSKRQLGGAEGEGVARGWVEDEEEEEERHQQLRQQKRRSQVQLEEASPEGAAGGESVGGEAPQEEVQPCRRASMHMQRGSWQGREQGLWEEFEEGSQSPT